MYNHTLHDGLPYYLFGFSSKKGPKDQQIPPHPEAPTHNRKARRFEGPPWRLVERKPTGRFFRKQPDFPWQRDWWKIINQFAMDGKRFRININICSDEYWNDLRKRTTLYCQAANMNMNIWIVIVFLTLEELYLLHMLVLRPLKMVYDDSFIAGSSCSWCILDGSSFNLHKCPCKRQQELEALIRNPLSESNIIHVTNYYAVILVLVALITTEGFLGHQETPTFIVRSNKNTFQNPKHVNQRNNDTKPLQIIRSFASNNK